MPVSISASDYTSKCMSRVLFFPDESRLCMREIFLSGKEDQMSPLKKYVISCFSGPQNVCVI